MEWNQVGFGWTSPPISSSSVSFLIPSQTIVFDTEEDFPSRLFYDSLIQKLPLFPFNYEKFKEIFRAIPEQYFLQNPLYFAHYEQFRSGHGVSNSRQLRWDIMHIPANTAFKLHAHPNIEIIWVICGSIHEYRLKDSTIYAEQFTNHPNEFLKGPNLRDIRDIEFKHNHIRAIPRDQLQFLSSILDLQSSFIVNEIGSIHLSFTREEAAVLLVVWSGCHANVSEDEYPVNAREIFQLLT